MNSVVSGGLSASLTDRHGVRLTRVTPRPTVPHPRPPRAPDTRPYLVGRAPELARVRAREAVEFTGPCGTGKTTLLRAVPDGVYVRVGPTALEDLLQDLMRRFHTWPGPVRFTTEECARALAAVEATVVLDDVSYTPQQLAYLKDVLRGCALVTGAVVPALGAAGGSCALQGLSEGAATALLAHDLGRALSGAEQAVVGRLVTAVGGQPLHLRQAAALVRHDGHTLADVTTRAEGDPDVLDELCIAALGPQAKRVLAVLTLLGGALLPAGVLAQMADVAYVAQTFESLSARGLAEQRDDRFGLPVCKAEPYRHVLYRHLGLAVAARSLASWLASCAPAGPDARGALDAALGLLGLAAERREWQTVVRLVTVVERVLFVQGHWEAWQNTLAQGITAAREAGDAAAEAYFAHQQGVQHFLHGRVEHARGMLRRALELRESLGDAAGAEVTRANLALLAAAGAPPLPSAPPGGLGVPGASGRSPDARRRVVVAVAAVVGVLVIGTAVGQGMGGGGESGGGGASASRVGVTAGESGSATGAGAGGAGVGGSSGESSGGDTGPTGTVSGSASVSSSASGSSSSGSSGSSSSSTTGTLAAPRISPSSRDFGMTHIHPSVDAPTVDFTVTNPNDRAIDLGPATVPGASAFSYADGTCGDRLGAGESCTVTVEFAPSGLGPESDRLTIASGGRTATADLSGTGYVGLTVVLLGGRDSSRLTATDPSAGEVCAGYTSVQCTIRVTAEPVLTAVLTDPGARYVMKGWSGACVGSNPCVPALASDDSSTVTARFAPYLG
ncbi:hypothetical protein IAG44_24395 [Streptomyces roseirectus]|uniref:Uncharacterized protein n=1 Tax=Streptomyces roseirectus TaxID=2768066 RepID=A0A7H0IHH8_9ACTN|nr:hypothetical protein [Streptomyces roseirectus]QNP72244.1 hypothetical protein IAG44_24395 [Streptomyces roseirectus]